MKFFLIKRLGTFAATLFAATLLTFFALEVLPGDPALVILGVDAPDSAVAALREQLGLNRPVTERYIDWISHFLRGELGVSYTYSVPVSELLRERLAITIPLALMAMALSVVIAFSLGIYAATHHNRHEIGRASCRERV